MAKFQFVLDCFRKRGTVIPPHFHDYCELVYYFGGKGRSDYRQNDVMPYKSGEFLVPYERAFSTDKHFRFDDNAVVFYKPYTVHNEIHEKDCNILAVGFYPTRDILPESCIFHSVSEKIADLFAKIRLEYSEKKKNFALAIDGLTDEILCELTRSEPNSTPEVSSLHYVKIYIDNYYMTDVTVAFLADMAGFSPDYFRKLFIREYGITPKEYLLQRRLSEADSLLKSSELPVSAVATQVGFTDVSQFSRFYKERRGVSPSRIK